MNDEPLDQVNRFVIVVAALGAIFVALLVVLLAWGAASNSIARLDDLAGWLRDHNDRETKVVITLVATVVVLAMLTAIIIELTPSPTQKMRVRGIKSGSGAITTTQIAERINTEVLYIEHIAGSNAIVAARGRRVEVVLDLQVDEGADLARAADAACRSAQALVEQQLGIELAQPPRARLRYRELRLRKPPGTPSGAARGQDATGWERPPVDAEGDRDQRRPADASEEAQAQAD